MTKFKDFYGNDIENELTVDTVSHGLMANEDKIKLDTIEAGSNKYIHPTTHPATMITGDSTHRFVTDQQIANWNVDKDTTYSNATTSIAGLMSAADKTKMDSVASSANNYSHPSTHPATMIVEDTSHRFITDAERTAWNAKASTAVATTSANGLMTAAMVTKLNSIATSANAYTHPTTSGNKHIPAGGSNGQILRWSADGTAAWGADNNTTYNNATTTTAGLMSAADKVLVNNCTYTSGGSITTGYYRKYGDGTLEMWGKYQLEYTNTLWVGTLSSSGFSYSAPFTITLPVTVIGDLECNINIHSSNVSWASIQSYTSGTVKYVIVCPTPDKFYSASIHWSVKGKWK